MENSYSWNWDSLACLTSPGISRLLHLNEIYNLILELPGDIFEFGCHFGASTSILNNLKNIYEPRSNRKIHTFDTFEGLSKPDAIKDKSIHIKNNAGDYNTGISNYNKVLERLLTLHENYILLYLLKNLLL